MIGPGGIVAGYALWALASWLEHVEPGLWPVLLFPKFGAILFAANGVSAIRERRVKAGR